MNSKFINNIFIIAFLVFSFSILSFDQVQAECQGGAADGGLDRIEICDGTLFRGGASTCADLGDTSATSGAALVCKADCTIDSSMCHGGFNLDPTTDAPDNAPTDFNDAVLNLINWILGFAASISVLMLILGGYMYMASAGDTSKAEKGKKTVSAGLIGLVIAGIAFAIVNVIVNTILT